MTELDIESVIVGAVTGEKNRPGAIKDSKLPDTKVSFSADADVAVAIRAVLPVTLLIIRPLSLDENLEAICPSTTIYFDIWVCRVIHGALIIISIITGSTWK